MHESDGPIYVPPGPSSSRPVIPGQRAPLPVEFDELPPLPFLPGAPPQPSYQRPRRVRTLLAGGSLAVIVALSVTVYVTGNDPLAEKATAAGVQPTARATPLSPADALEIQADALLKGDEKGWLAAVDPAQPKLRARYRTMFRSLRGLGVSHFVYDTSTAPADAKTGVVDVSAQVEYCFSTDKCPEEKYNQSDGPPTITQELKLKPVKGAGYVITALAANDDDEDQQPTPWESDDLVFAQGKRVTLVARAQRAEILQAGPPDGRQGRRWSTTASPALLNNPQKKYRIYLAGPKQWKTWYGGITDKWVIGYAMPLSDAGTDVVINISEVRNDHRLLASTIQHELGHVVTLSGAYRTGGQGDMWMKEGIAEYIGWYPKPSTASWRRPAVRDAVRGGNRPKSIAVKALAAKASPEDSDAFYGLGHFAADCMSRTYGQRALFTFVRLYLRENRDLDPAAKEAFGQPFTTVDKTCLAWTRDKA